MQHKLSSGPLLDDKGNLAEAGYAFELAKAFGGYTNLRFDDTNPVNEGAEYVDANG